MQRDTSTDRAERSERGVGVLLGPGVLTALLFAGYFKASPYLEWVPLDLTLAAASCVTLGIGFEIVRRNGHMRISGLGLLFVAAMCVGFLNPPDNPYATDARVKLLLVGLSMIGAIVLINTYRRQQIWVWLFVIVGLALTTLASQQSTEVLADRLGSGHGDAIATGQACGAAIVVLLVLLVSGGIKGTWRVLFTLAMVTWLISALILTGSRGPVLAVVVAVLVVAALQPRRGRLSRFMAAALSVAGGWWMLTRTEGFGAERLRTSFSNSGDLAQTRSRIWARALESIPDHPMGFGWGNFWNALDEGSKLDSSYRQYAHNIVLQVFSEAGWVAGIVTIVFLWLAIARLVRNAHHTYGAALLGIGVFFLLAAMVSGDMNDNRVLWAVLASAWVLKPPPGSDRETTTPREFGSAAVFR